MLEDPLSNEFHKFNLYKEKDLPLFKGKKSSLVKENIIKGDMDDDCQTDEEILGQAQDMMISEL